MYRYYLPYSYKVRAATLPIRSRTTTSASMAASLPAGTRLLFSLMTRTSGSDSGSGDSLCRKGEHSHQIYIQEIVIFSIKILQRVKLCSSSTIFKYVCYRTNINELTSKEFEAKSGEKYRADLGWVELVPLCSVVDPKVYIYIYICIYIFFLRIRILLGPQFRIRLVYEKYIRN